PLKAMVDKKRGVKAKCANALKASEVMAQRRAAEAEAKAQAEADAEVDVDAEAQLHQLQTDLKHREQQNADKQESAWQPAAQTSATRATAQRVHSEAPTALLTTSNSFATLRVADEQEKQLPSQPAKLDEHQAAAAAVAVAAVAPVLRAAVEAEGQEQG
ncbi:hypothetical protein QJQ45_025521, partial [Haematococcus lacustris]